MRRTSAQTGEDKDEDGRRKMAAERRRSRAVIDCEREANRVNDVKPAITTKEGEGDDAIE